MKSSRRSVLKFLGLAPAAPLAAKLANDEKLLSLVRGRETLASGYGYDSGYGIPSSPKQSPDYVNPYIRVAEYVKVFGIPKHVEEAMRQEAKYITALDPDIAAKKAWSMSVKILTQRERNYQDSIIRLEKQGAYQRAQEVFRGVTGWEWGF